MNQTVASQSLDVSLLNSNQQPVAYLNQANAMTLNVTNATTSPITLSGPASGAPTTMILDCTSQVLSPEVFAAISITLDGWQCSYDQDDNVWILAVAKDGLPAWGVNAPLVFQIGNLDPAGQPKSGTLNLTPTAVPPLDPNPAAMQLFVQQVPNQPRDLLPAMIIASPASTVNITKSSLQVVNNTISLRLANASATNPIIPDNAAWLDNPPTFVISFYFVANDDPLGFNALTSEELGQQIQISLGQGTPGYWKLTPQLDNPQALSWLVQPTPANHQVLGIGLNSLVEIDFDNIVSYLTAGPTCLFLQWYDFPGYNDGYTALFLNKTYAPMQITSFEVFPTSLDFSLAPLSVSLMWNVVNASHVQLNVVGQVPFNTYGYQYDNIQQDTTFVLTAYDIFTGDVQTSQQRVTISQSFVSHLVPSGTIAVWSGRDPSQIPAPWVLCDGRSGTPDLRDMFIMATNVRDPAHPSHGPSPHQHSLTLSGQTTTSQDGYHQHALPSPWYERNLSCGCHPGIDVYGCSPSSTPVVPNGAHAHSLSLNYPSFMTDNNTSFSRPAWASLYYVMKL